MKVYNSEKGRRRITKSVSRAYRERGSNYSNCPNYTYQIKGKEAKEKSTLLQDKEEHQDQTRETSNPYQNSNFHRRLTKTTRESNPSKEKGRRRNIKTSFSQVSNHLCQDACHKINLIRRKRFPTGETISPTGSVDNPTGNSFKPIGNT